MSTCSVELVACHASAAHSISVQHEAVVPPSLNLSVLVRRSERAIQLGLLASPAGRKTRAEMNDADETPCVSGEFMLYFAQGHLQDNCTSLEDAKRIFNKERDARDSE